MASRFGEMLMARRRMLGLSIQQVSNRIKIRPQIIEYFELGDFASMPPRGYAQGMISSYANFLGLNAHEVVDAYFDELQTYERVNKTGAGRFQDSVAEASPHGDYTKGRFMMVGAMPPSRYVQRPQQAGYVSESSSPHEPVPISRLRADTHGRSNVRPRSEGTPSQGRLAFSAEEGGAYRGRGELALTPASRARDAYPAQTAGRPLGARSATAASSSLPRGGGNVRPSRPQDRPRPRPGGGTSPAPQGLRSAERASQRVPRSGGASAGPLPRGGRPAQKGPAVQLIVLALVLLVLCLLGGFAFKGCSAPAPAPSGSSAPSASSSSTSSPSDGGSADSLGASDADLEEDLDKVVSDLKEQEAADDKKHDAQGDDSGPVKVTISLGKGKTSWVEVKLDGKYVYSGTPVGPLKLEYDVVRTLEVTVNNPSDVVVKKNGERVRYDSKSSGVGRITISAPVPDPQAQNAEGGQGGEDASSQPSSSDASQ